MVAKQDCRTLLGDGRQASSQPVSARDSGRYMVACMVLAIAVSL